MRIFKNQTERAFYDYLLSTRKYKESSVWHYILRLRKINSLDVLITQDIDLHIADYESGMYKNENVKSHGAYSCALKRLKEFMKTNHII